jgi:gamma-glutamylcyclotransferase (GGCT)/AIG2-like uncharacterized protein YtfP
VLYFAYGSNMLASQMNKRCPSARFVCVAVLADHALVFPRKSKRWGCGVASIEPGDDKVWGVVYQIDELDIGRLDKCEGFSPGRVGNSYVREERRVLRHGQKDDPLTVWTYIGAPQAGPPKPNACYLKRIIGGAKHWRLPEDYVRKLEAIETKG